MSLERSECVAFFRHTSPYINAHRGKTFVLMIDGEGLAADNCANIVQDVALLNSLGVSLVLVHGARPQIESRLRERGLASRLHRGLRVTDDATLECVKEAVGSLRTDLEARFTLGLPNSPMHGARVRLCGGNFVTAKPLGVVDGIDYCHTGEVRRVDAAAIRQLLNQGSLVLLSNIGYSPSGEVFNLAVEEVASRVASALHADKLVCFGESPGLLNQRGERHSELLTRAAERLLHQYLDKDDAQTGERNTLARHLGAITRACREGVERGHLISHHQDGALLMELYTREGAGTMVVQESYEQVRQASIEDVGGILELIQPLEAQGVLVRRSRERLETEINCFMVVERDAAIIGCAALFPFADGSAELACVAVHPDYRGGDRGGHLLGALETSARERGLSRLFVLTTRTAHWFLEQGFREVSRDHLPAQRQALYNLQRNSKVFEKEL